MGPLFAVVLAVSAAEAQPCPKRTLRLYASWALQGDRSQETFDWRQQDQRPLLTKIRDSGADLVYLGAAVETGAPLIIRQLVEADLVAPRVRVMGPDGLLQDTLLRRVSCASAMASGLRVTFPGLPFEKMTRAGERTYADYKRRFGEKPTAFALYAVEAGRVAIDGIRRAASELDRTRDLWDKRDAVRRAVAATKDFDGINGTWSFDRNGDIDLNTTSGFNVVRAESPLRGRFQFETIVE